MRDERARSRRAGAGGVVVAAVALLAARAPAQTITGSAQVQYQRNEQSLVTVGPDSRPRILRITQEYWLQTYELNHATRIGNDLNIASQLRFSDLSYPGHPERSQTPYGTIRVAHPLFGLTGSYRPATASGSVGAAGIGGLADSTARTRVTTRTQEGMMTGYLALPRLPRFDMQWVQRHRDADAAGSEQTGLSRSVRSTWEVGPLSLRGGVTDQAAREPVRGTLRTLQRGLEGGAGLRLVPSAATHLDLQYDFMQTRRGAGLPNALLSRLHNSSVNGGWRLTPRSDLALFYTYQRSLSGSSLAEDIAHDEGSLLYNWRRGRSLRFTGGGGMRSAGTGTGNDRTRYLTSVITADGAVRPRWQGTASLSHGTNWEPGRRGYSVESFHAGSRATLRQGLELQADMLVGQSSDSAARAQRWTSQGSLALVGRPLRGFNATLGTRFYHAGPTLLGSSADSRSVSLSMAWQPFRGFSTNAMLSRTGALPHNDPRLSSAVINAQWQLAPRLQASGSYSHSSQTRQVSGPDLAGRDVWNGRMLLGLTRTFTANAGMSVSDPGRPNRIRQFDVAVTKSFGR